MVSLVLACSHLFSLVLACSHLFSLVLTCFHLFSLVLTCSRLFSLVLTCSHLFPLGLTCSYLFSLGLTCSHLGSLLAGLAGWPGWLGWQGWQAGLAGLAVLCWLGFFQCPAHGFYSLLLILTGIWMGFKSAPQKTMQIAVIIKRGPVTRPHSFASPARTARTNKRNRIRFPGLRGDGQAELAPPNL